VMLGRNARTLQHERPRTSVRLAEYAGALLVDLAGAARLAGKHNSVCTNLPCAAPACHHTSFVPTARPALEWVHSACECTQLRISAQRRYHTSVCANLPVCSACLPPQRARANSTPGACVGSLGIRVNSDAYLRPTQVLVQWQALHLSGARVV
jgi:hypothetical protein